MTILKDLNLHCELLDFAPEAAPAYKPISFDKSEVHKLAYWNLYNNKDNAVCYYIGHKLDPFHVGYGGYELGIEEGGKAIATL